MTGSACSRIDELIGVPRDRLSEAERLMLEEHLATCSFCNEQSGLMRALNDVASEFPDALRDTARVRAISGAIRIVRDEQETRQLSRAPRRWLYGGVAAAAAAGVLLAVWAADSGSSIAPRATVAPVAVPAAAAVAQREPARELAEDESAERVVESTGGTSVRLAHARVELASATRVRLAPQRDAIVLEAGQARFEADGGEARRFEVQTSHFRVEVLGSRFVVSERSISVEQGRATVFAVDGTELAKDLGPGATFSLEPASAAPKAVRREAAPALLARAREALSRGDTSVAQAFVRRAEEENPHRTDRAEAGTLRAEIALLERDPAIAVKTYLSVAERFADLPAGENAQFAAAQLLRRQGDTGAARAAFERYLVRYPRGRFAEEAARRLRQAP